MKIDEATRAQDPTHPGDNEDTCNNFKIERKTQTNQTTTIAVAVLADGIGGEPAGKEASQLAVAEIRKSLTANVIEGSFSRRLTEAVQAANKAIYNEALADANKRGMGTTIVIAAVENDLLYVAHVGDSRVYLVRNGVAYCCTRDHVRVIRSNRPEQVHDEERRLSQRLGRHEKIEVDLTIRLEPTNESIQLLPPNRKVGRNLILEDGDKILLASDGLSILNLKEIQDQASQRGTPKEIAERLIEQVPVGSDDVTVVVMERPAAAVRLLRYVGYAVAVLGALVLAVVLWNLLPRLILSPTPPATPTPTLPPTSTPGTVAATEIPETIVPTDNPTSTDLPIPTDIPLPTPVPPTNTTTPDFNKTRIAEAAATVTALAQQAADEKSATAQAVASAAAALELTAGAQTPTPVPQTPTPGTPQPAVSPESANGITAADCTNIPNADALQVTLAPPLDVAPGSGRRDFKWNGPTLSAQGAGLICAYELVFYKNGWDPVKEGYGWAGTSFTPSSTIDFSPSLRPMPELNTTYQWGVRLVVLKTDEYSYQPIKMLSLGQTGFFRYEVQSGGGSGGGSNGNDSGFCGGAPCQ